LGKEVSALLQRIGIKGAADGLPQAVAGSFCGLAQRRLELGKSLLDRVETGTVGRQIDEPGTLRGDGFLTAGDLQTDCG
jgi:hypothetical protein